MANHNQIQLKVLEDDDTQRRDSVETDELPDIRGDRQNLALLLLLCLMQGIPIGLTATIPMMLQKRGASYTTQAKFRFVFWPFTLKLLWAPIVDACFSQRFGRRKSWLIPVQYLIGVFMLILSFHIDEWLGGPEKEANISVLIGIFFVLVFLAATQDIAIDGWSLTMLKRRNIGYASVCNSIASPGGAYLAYAVLLSLESTDFCNTYLRSEPQDTGILTHADFLWFCGICYLVTTTLVAIVKKENEPKVNKPLDNYAEHEKSSLLDTYKIIFRILNIPSIKLLVLILLTVKFIWADHDGLAILKFLDSGISNEKMIPLEAVSDLPVQILVTCVVAKYAASSNPTKMYINTIPFRTLFSLTTVAIIWLTPRLIPETGIAPLYIYFVYLGNYVLYSICSYSMHITMSAFLFQISDATVGGTYMTLLNTVHCMSGTWAQSLALWVVELLAWRDCGLTVASDSNGQMGHHHHHHNKTDVSSDDLQTKCPIVVDGYYVEAMICLAYGIVWYCWGAPKIRQLQKLPIDAWRANKKTKDIHE